MADTAVGRPRLGAVPGAAGRPARPARRRRAAQPRRLHPAAVVLPALHRRLRQRQARRLVQHRPAGPALAGADAADQRGRLLPDLRRGPGHPATASTTSSPTCAPASSSSPSPRRWCRPALQSISGNLGLIRALHFPRASLPLAMTLTQFQQLVASMVVLIGIVLVTGEPLDRRVAAAGAGAAAAVGVQRRAGAGGGPARREAHRPASSSCRSCMRTWMYGSGVFYSVDLFAEHLPPAGRPTLVAGQPAAGLHRAGAARAAGGRAAGLAAAAALAARRSAGRCVVGIGGFVYFWRGETGVRPWLSHMRAPPRPAAAADLHPHPHRRRRRRARGLPGARSGAARRQPGRGAASACVTGTRRADVREVHAVKGVSFAAYEGEAIGLIGSNGSGKSTLLRAIAGLLPADRGRRLHQAASRPCSASTRRCSTTCPASATSCSAAWPWA